LTPEQLLGAVINGASAVIALAALGLGVFNYRQARRRDTYQLRAAVTQSIMRPKDGPAEAYDLDIELTNVVQRPVTVTDIAMVWRQSGIGSLVTRRGWRLRWRRSYQWHTRLRREGHRLVENHPEKVLWGWAGAADHFESAQLGPKPVLVGIQVRMGATDTKLMRVRNRKAVEETARAIREGELRVYRLGHK